MEKKILVIINSSNGLYKFRVEFLQKLIDNKNKVYIIAAPSKWSDTMREMGCEFIDNPIDRRGTNIIKEMKLLIKYIKYIKEIKPDLVLTYTIKPNIYGGIACMLLKVPYISTITGMGSALNNKGLLQKFVIRLYKFVEKKCEKIFFQNEGNREFFLNNKIIEKEKTRVVTGSGVNTNNYKYEEYPPCNNNAVKFLFIGRIMKEKGIEEYLNVATKVKQKYPNTEFHIIGGYDEEKYKERIEKLNEDKIIIYHGETESSKPYIKCTHCTIHPSYHEGMANAILETEATGRPAIVSNVSGCKEMVDDGKNGYVFEVKNEDELQSKVEKFINLTYEEKKNMGIVAREKVEKDFNRNTVINTYMEEVNKVLYKNS